MKLFSRFPGICLVLILSLGLLGCQEKTETKPQAKHAMPVVINPGMRAYVDPVTGQYAPAPPQAEQPRPFVPAAGIVSPDSHAATPKEIPLPGGGVMIELGDQFQTNSRPAH